MRRASTPKVWILVSFAAALFVLIAVPPSRWSELGRRFLLGNSPAESPRSPAAVAKLAPRNVWRRENSVEHNPQSSNREPLDGAMADDLHSLAQVAFPAEARTGGLHAPTFASLRPRFEDFSELAEAALANPMEVADGAETEGASPARTEMPEVTVELEAADAGNARLEPLPRDGGDELVPLNAPFDAGSTSVPDVDLHENSSLSYAADHPDSLKIAKSDLPSAFPAMDWADPRRRAIEAELAQANHDIGNSQAEVRLVRSPETRRLPDTSAADPNLQRQSTVPLTDALAKWPNPHQLLNQLETVAALPEHATWSRAAIAALQRLRAIPTLDAPEVRQILQELEATAKQVHAVSLRTEDAGMQMELIRISHAIQRRVVVWRQVHTIAAERFIPVAATGVHAERVRTMLAEIDRKLQSTQNGQAWRDYLLIRDLQKSLAATPSTTASAVVSTVPIDAADPRELARRVLVRLQFAQQNAQQREFCQQAGLLKLATEMKLLAAEPIDYPELLKQLELVESNRLDSQVDRLAAAQQTLLWSNSHVVAALGQSIEANYRNANLRISVTDEFLNRFLPAQDSLREDVDEIIAGALTRGESETQAKVKVNLVPSKDDWQIGVKAAGEVASSTYSSRGPARFFHRGASEFEAEKTLAVDADGVKLQPSRARANAATRLMGLETDFDGFPIIGDLAQAIALQMHANKEPSARFEMRNRVANRVSDRLDQVVSDQLETTQQQFNERLLGPLRNLALNPTVIDLQTTDKRLIGRYRLASYDQLAAFTPRPVAPAGNIFSVQIHESALNNVVDQLAWEGRRANVQDLVKETADLFHAGKIQLPEDFPRDVTVQFAEKNPMRFSFDDGLATLRIALAELKQGQSEWKDFVVRVHYRHDPQQPGTDLIRDQYVELIGERLHFRDQVALRGIFSRVFARSQPIRLLSDRMAGSKQLNDVHFTQFMLDDGWLGIAIGREARPPEETARRPTPPAAETLQR